MKQRAAEVLFRYKLLILLPVFIIVPITVAIAARPQPKQWQAFATIWVDQYKPLYQDERLGWTPANNQAQLLNDFIHTRSFAQQVLQQTSLAYQLERPDTEASAVFEFWRSVQVWATSNNFVTIVVTTNAPDVSYETAQALISTYQATLRQRTETQAKIALSLQGDALAKAEQTLAKSRNELSAYLTAHPELVGRRSDGALLTQQDSTLARLSAQASYDEDAYNAARRHYDQLQANASAGLEGQQLSFTVVDQPERPLTPISRGRLGLLKLPTIGLVLALMISSGIAVVFILTNRAVLGPQDIQRSLGIVLIGEVPELRGRRWWWQRTPPDAVRLRLAAPARAGSPRAG